MRLALFVVVVFVAGCASAPRIVSLPSGNFLATGLASRLEGGAGQARNAALELAVRHCKASGKRVEVVEVTSADPAPMGIGAVDVEFTCVPDA